MADFTTTPPYAPSYAGGSRVTALFQLLYCVRTAGIVYGRTVAYYNMLAWWRQRTEHEQVQWCNVVHDHGSITPEMADVVGSNRSGNTPGGAWLTAIRDSSAPVTAPEQTWIMSRRFEAFIREQCP